MRAEVRELSSPDVDLQTYRPRDASDVDVFVEVVAGPTDGVGEEIFGVQIVTTRALERRVSADGPLIARHFVVVLRWDFSAVKSFLTERFEREEASTWDALATRLARIGHWEFEDYRPS